MLDALAIAISLGALWVSWKAWTRTKALERLDLSAKLRLKLLERRNLPEKHRDEIQDFEVETQHGRDKIVGLGRGQPDGWVSSAIAGMEAQREIKRQQMLDRQEREFDSFDVEINDLRAKLKIAAE